MNKPIETIGIIKESRPDENRAPLVPEHIEKLKSKYPNLNIIVQPSKKKRTNQNRSNLIFPFFSLWTKVAWAHTALKYS